MTTPEIITDRAGNKIGEIRFISDWCADYRLAAIDRNNATYYTNIYETAIKWIAE